MKLPPQFNIVLPVNTPTEEVEVHARARLKGVLAQHFDIFAIKSVRSGKIMTKHGPVLGEQFVIVLHPIGGFVEQEDDENGEVLYEHPNYKKLIIH